MDEHIVGTGDAVPAKVSVHCIKTTNNRPDATDTDSLDFRFKPFDEFQSQFRSGVASVGDHMNDDLVGGNVLTLAVFNQRNRMVDM